MKLLACCSGGRGAALGRSCPGAVWRGARATQVPVSLPHILLASPAAEARRGPCGHAPWPGCFKEQAALLLGRREHSPLIAER